VTGKTLITDGHEIQCRGCGIKVPDGWSVDRARADLWRIPWVPGESIWCPGCWGAIRNMRRSEPAAYDEPMF
jgi:hypothetical protein